MSKHNRYLQTGAILAERLDSIADLVNDGWVIASAPKVVKARDGKGISFDGADDKFSLTSKSKGVKSVSFWVKPATTTEQFVDLDGGTNYVHVSSGTLTATGFTSPTIYVNDIVSSVIVANTWQLVTVATATAITPSNIQLATDNTNFGNVEMSQLLLFDRTLSAQEVSDMYLSKVFSYEDSLVSHWKLDNPDNIRDIAPAKNNNDGIPTSIVSADVISGHNGRNKAISFDGSANFITPNNASDLNFSAPATLSFWIKTTSDNPEAIFSMNEGANNENSFTIFVGQNVGSALTNELLSIFSDDAGSTIQLCGYTTAMRTELFDGQWHHVVFSSNASSWSIYLDGESKTVTVGDGNTGVYGGNSTFDIVRIGNRRRNGSNNVFFTGEMSDVRIYNKALSAIQVKDLYLKTLRN